MVIRPWWLFGPWWSFRPWWSFSVGVTIVFSNIPLAVWKYVHYSVCLYVCFKNIQFLQIQWLMILNDLRKRAAILILMFHGFYIKFQMILPTTIKRKHSVKDINILPLIKKVRAEAGRRVPEYARMEVSKRTEEMPLRGLWYDFIWTFDKQTLGSSKYRILYQDMSSVYYHIMITWLVNYYSTSRL